jgi:hypothetical protein
MKKSVLDTSVLLAFWHQSRGRDLGRKTARDARGWARRLQEMYETDAIVTPTYIEVIGGTLTRHELDLTRAYLGEFRRIDAGRVLPEDWEQAIRLAQRIPARRRPRDLGDCLIRAIANRLRHDVVTFDQGFP